LPPWAFRIVQFVVAVDVFWHLLHLALLVIRSVYLFAYLSYVLKSGSSCLFLFFLVCFPTIIFVCLSCDPNTVFLCCFPSFLFSVGWRVDTVEYGTAVSTTPTSARCRVPLLSRCFCRCLFGEKQFLKVTYTHPCTLVCLIYVTCFTFAPPILLPFFSFCSFCCIIPPFFLYCFGVAVTTTTSALIENSIDWFQVCQLRVFRAPLHSGEGRKENKGEL
jgi:hypothetical protein